MTGNFYALPRWQGVERIPNSECFCSFAGVSQCGQGKGANGSHALDTSTARDSSSKSHDTGQLPPFFSYLPLYFTCFVGSLSRSGHIPSSAFRHLPPGAKMSWTPAGSLCCGVCLLYCPSWTLVIRVGGRMREWMISLAFIDAIVVTPLSLSLSRSLSLSLSRARA